MPGPEQKPEFTRITLKYKSVDAFAQVAKTTFAKGRMTLKTKKDLAENQRIVLVIKFPDTEAAIEIISEVIQKVAAPSPEESSTYGVRWLNFSEKKLTKFMDAAKKPAGPPPPPASGTELPAPPPPAVATTSAGPEPAKPAEPKPAPPPAPARKVKTPVVPPIPPRPDVLSPAPTPAEKIAEEKPAPPKPAIPKKTPPPPPPTTPEKTPDTLIAPPPASPPSEPPAPAEETPAPPAPKPEPAPLESTSPQSSEPPEEEVVINLERGPVYPSFEEEPSTVIVPPPADEINPAPPPAGPEEIEKPESKPEESSLPTPEAPPPSTITETQPSSEGSNLEIDADTSLDLQTAPENPPPPELDQVEMPSPATEPSPSLPEEPAPPGGPSPLAEESKSAEPGPEALANLPETSLPSGEASAPAPPPEPISAEPESVPPTPPEPEAETISPQPEAVGPEALPPESPLSPGTAELSELGPIPTAQELRGEEREEPELEERPASEEEREAQRPLSADELSQFGIFLQKLIKLILQWEKLPPPEGERLMKPLYEEFKSLFREREEIALFVRSLGQVREFMLSGDILGPVNLKNALPPQLFNELAVKVVELFSAKQLCGLQFQKYLTESGFRRFIQRLSQYDPEKERPEDLAAGLLGDGIFHLTPIHEADRVSEAGDLDFRVDMTLSRLRGEIKQLKVLAAAMSEEPSAVLTLRVEDALKAVPEGALRAQVLLHINEVLAGQEEITRSDLAQEIILATPLEMLAVAGQSLAQEFEELFAQNEAAPDETKKERLEQYRWVLRQVAARLTVEDPEAATQIMGGLYRRGVFTLEELPPQLRERVMLEQFIEAFLQEPEKRLQDFSHLNNLKAYKIAANRYLRMIIELVRRHEVEVADQIFRTLIQHIKSKEGPFPERPAAAREALSQLGNPAAVSVLTTALAQVEREKRDKVAAMILASGSAAAEPLLELLAKNEDRGVRRLICEILTRLGQAVVPAVAAKARSEEAPWFLVRNLVMILSDLASPALKEEQERFLRHPHPRVREEALVYVVKILGADSEPLLVRALTDPEPFVRRRAVRLLSRFSELSDSSRLALVKFLETKPSAEPTGEEEQAFQAAVELLTRDKNWTTPEGKSLEEIFMEILEEETPGFLSRLAGARSALSPAMRASLIEGLGKVGTGKAKKVLGHLAKDKDPLVKQSAQTALASLSGK